MGDVFGIACGIMWSYIILNVGYQYGKKTGKQEGQDVSITAFKQGLSVWDNDGAVTYVKNKEMITLYDFRDQKGAE